MASTARYMPCEGGLSHRFDKRGDGGAWDRSMERCARCGFARYELTVYCSLYACGPERNQEHVRVVATAPNYPDWKAGAGDYTTVQRDVGSCEWCLDKYAREDERRQRDQERTLEVWQSYARADEREIQRKEREEQWRQERARTAERSRQKTRLREGRATLTAIRRHLSRGARGSLLLASEPETTSRTS